MSTDARGSTAEPGTETGGPAPLAGSPAGRTPREVVDSLHRATNAHDLEAIVAHFAPDYVLDDPCHPDRSFTGRSQVRRNWSQILGAIPDLTVDEHASAVSGPRVWTDLEMRGSRPDGSVHRMRGVMVFDVDAGLISRARFFLQPVAHDGLDADSAVRAATSPRTAGP